MAIDDNTSYELTGLQVKDLAQKVKAKVDSSSLAAVATSGDYTDLLNTPTIPTVNDATLTITQNGATAGTFTANSNSDTTISLTDTTYTDFAGATSLADGAAGLVPKPLIADTDKFLKGDGTWGAPAGTAYTAGANIQISAQNVISATDTTYSAFTGATSSVAGSAGLVPAPTTSDPDKYLKGDGTWAEPAAKLVEMSYGESNAWAKFIAAYNAGSIVYCRASSNANPGTGSQTRKAFMAYVNNATSPTNVEFQYVRSMSSKTDSQQCDQVFVYTLTNASGGTWSVASRNMGPKVNVNGPITKTFTSGANATVTIGVDTMTGATSSAAGAAGVVPAPAAGDDGKVLRGDGTWVTPTDTTYTAGANVQISAQNVISATDTTYSDMVGADSSTAGAAGLVPAPAAGDQAKVLSGAGTWVNQPTVPTVGNATLTVKWNGTSAGTFTANATSNKTINIVPSRPCRPGTTVLDTLGTNGTISSSGNITMTYDGFFIGKAVTFTNGGVALVQTQSPPSNAEYPLGGIPYSGSSTINQVAFHIPVHKNQKLYIKVSGTNSRIEQARIVEAVW